MQRNELVRDLVEWLGQAAIDVLADHGVEGLDEADMERGLHELCTRHDVDAGAVFTDLVALERRGRPDEEPEGDAD